MNKIKRLEDLCGNHIFSGCEITSEATDSYGRMMDRQVCLFALDGTTYRLAEDPDDGYRSYCEELIVSNKPPRYRFRGVNVVCSMLESNKHEKYDMLVVRDAKNGKDILKVGTDYTEAYYPFCLFEYTPENMAINQ